MANPELVAPAPPHAWVTPQACLGCGEQYDLWHPGVTFAEGCQAIRNAAGDRHQCGGGGYRSRRAVLWAMRVIKLEAWYLRHLLCAPDVVLDPEGGNLVDPVTHRVVF